MIEQGDPRKPAIVFLHGSGANQQMWLPQLQALSDEFHTVAFNQPGHGSRQDEAFTLDGAAAETVAWLEENAPKGAILVGLSGGGYVAMVTAAQRPDLVLGMVLSGSTASYSGWGGFVTKLYGLVFPVLGKRLEPKANESWRAMAPPEVAGPLLGEGISMKAAAGAFRQIPGRGYRAMLAAYQGPVLILNGERDGVNRKEEDDLLEARPDAQVITIEDAGHACSITKPEVFNDYVRDFARLHARSPS